MEIKDYGELNALNKLLGKIKFQTDLDFYEFKEFASSPIIAEIFKRVNEEFLSESIKRGYIKADEKPIFEFNSISEQAICKRIDELTDQECKTLRSSGDQAIKKYLYTLVKPLHISEKEFILLQQYADKKIKGETKEVIK